MKLETIIPILISSVALFFSGYNFWKQYLTDKNAKENTINNFNEIIIFYNHLLEILNNYSEIIANKDLLYKHLHSISKYIVDENYLNQILTILEKQLDSTVSLNCSIIEQIVLLKNLIKYEDIIKTCIVVTPVPYNLPVKQIMQLPRIIDIVNRLINQREKIIIYRNDFEVTCASMQKNSYSNKIKLFIILFLMCFIKSTSANINL